MLTLDEVLRGLGEARLAHPVDAGISFADVTNDTRRTTAGSLFVALLGERDGHAFIADAYRRGATGVIAHRLVELDWLPAEARAHFAYIIADDSLAGLQRLAASQRDRFPVDVIGVTGSVGKTTTKEAVAGVLARRYPVLKTEGNLNSEIGLPLMLLRLTPEHRLAVLEMAMYAIGDIATLCRIARPRVGVVTNVGVSHLERLGTVEQIAEAKTELVDCLPLDGWAILNGDDERVARMKARTKARVLTYGHGPGNDVRAETVVGRGLDGTSFVLRHGAASAGVSIRLPGQPGVWASLAAAAVGICYGMGLDEIAASLSDLEPELRLSRLVGPNGSVILNDTYNASPASMLAALDVLAQHPGRRFAVLGDMFELGSAEEEGHRSVGRRAAEVLQGLVVLGERARWIGEEAAAAGLGDVVFGVAVEDAALDLDLREGDVVLVKGSRGMRMERVVARLLERRGSG